MSRLPVLLLHAFPLDHRMWAATTARLPDLTVIAPDLPGRAIAGEPSLDAVADAVADDLRAASLGPVVVAGLSMGGYVALALLERHPDLVAALGLVDTKSTADAPEARANRLRIADEADATGSVDPVRAMSGVLLGESTRAARPELTRQVDAWIGAQDSAAVAWSQRAMAARPDRTEVLRAFAGPVVVVVGDEDTVTPAAGAELMASTAQRGRLVVVPRAGHLTAIEDPAAVADALIELANQL